MNLLSTLEEFFSSSAPTGPGDRILVGFSGGVDSTALLWGLRELAPRRQIEVVALHIDHGLDPDSRRRAEESRLLCEQLELPMVLVEASGLTSQSRGVSPEMAARRIRYQILEENRLRHDAVWSVTAHHANDQIETALLRLLYGSGLDGLTGISPRLGRVVRPLLGSRRTDLENVVRQTGLRAIQDPTNFDLSVPRNLIRHLILPELEQNDPTVADRVQRLAKAAVGARLKWENLLRQHLEPECLKQSVRVRPEKLRALPNPLRPLALALLHREAGSYYSAPRAAQQDLLRRLDAGDRIGCDCGGGWRWELESGWLYVRKQQPTTPAFAYTLRVPGECLIPELSLRFRLRLGPVSQWMFERCDRRVGLALNLGPGDSVLIRNRRPGDRLRPFGCSYSRRLKEVLIDRRVPRTERSRLPLLVVDSQLAWVPGVTIDDTFRVAPGGQAWIAELEEI